MTAHRKPVVVPVRSQRPYYILRNRSQVMRPPSYPSANECTSGPSLLVPSAALHKQRYIHRHYTSYHTVSTSTRLAPSHEPARPPPHTTPPATPPFHSPPPPLPLPIPHLRLPTLIPRHPHALPHPLPNLPVPPRLPDRALDRLPLCPALRGRDVGQVRRVDQEREALRVGRRRGEGVVREGAEGGVGGAGRGIGGGERRDGLGIGVEEWVGELDVDAVGGEGPVERVGGGFERG